MSEARHPDAHYLIQRIEQYKSVLEEIANQDYRGNPSAESQIAWRALQRESDDYVGGPRRLLAAEAKGFVAAVRNNPHADTNLVAAADLIERLIT